MATNINWFVLWVPSNQARLREMAERRKSAEIQQSGGEEKIVNHHTKFEAGWKYPQSPQKDLLTCSLKIPKFSFIKKSKI